MTVKNYDPNIRWANHRWVFTFQMWDYVLREAHNCGGNCRGLTTLQSALSGLADELFEKHGDDVKLVLARPRPDGGEDDTLECSPDGDDIEDWLEGMLVGAELVEHTQEKETQ